MINMVKRYIIVILLDIHKFLLFVDIR